MVNHRYFGWWITVVCILFLFAALAHFKPQLNEIKHYKQTEQEIRLTLQNKHQARDSLPTVLSPQERIKTSFKVQPLKIPEVLTQLIHTVEASGFTVQVLQPLPIQIIEQVSALPLKIILVGESSQLALLFSHLAQNPFKFNIQDFSIQINEQGTATLEMNSIVIGLQKVSVLRHLAPHVENTASIAPPSLIHTFSVEQLKLAGYLHNDRDFWAIMMLPNGKTQVVQRGSSIGIENGRVTEVSEDKVVVLIGQRQVVIPSAR